jgi:hypothetical protein
LFTARLLEDATMRRFFLWFALAALTLPAAASQSDAPAGALAAMDRFMAAFNARDAEAWADSLVYPHVRIASGRVTVFPDRVAFLAAAPFAALTASEGWHHSAWEDLDVVQWSPDKVHIAVVFARFRENGERYAVFPSLYVVERVDGRWGIRARSSFAP